MTVFSAHRRTLTLAAILAAAAMIVAGCSKKSTGVLAPDSELADARANGVLSLTNSAVRAVALVQERHTNELMAKAGVVGTATTADENGNLAVMVMTEQ